MVAACRGDRRLPDRHRSRAATRPSDIATTKTDYTFGIVKIDAVKRPRYGNMAIRSQKRYWEHGRVRGRLSWLSPCRSRHAPELADDENLQYHRGSVAVTETAFAFPATARRHRLWTGGKLTAVMASYRFVSTAADTRYARDVESYLNVIAADDIALPRQQPHAE